MHRELLDSSHRERILQRCKIYVKKGCVWFLENIKERKNVKENNFLMFDCTLI